MLGGVSGALLLLAPLQELLHILVLHTNSRAQVGDRRQWHSILVACCIGLQSIHITPTPCCTALYPAAQPPNTLLHSLVCGAQQHMILLCSIMPLWCLVHVWLETTKTCYVIDSWESFGSADCDSPSACTQDMQPQDSQTFIHWTYATVAEGGN